VSPRWRSWRDHDDWYPPPSYPRPAKGGIRLTGRKGGIATTWWASRWVAALERMGLGPRLGRGRSYARSGQVLRYEIQSGVVTAEVQGSRAKPYKVTIGLARFRPKEWNAAVEAMAKRVEFAARLLTGEMPETIDQAFRAAGLSLFPRETGDIKVDCTCPDWETVCKHVAAVCYIIGDAFDKDPFLLFALRGRSREEVLDAIRAARGLTGEAAGPKPAPAPEPEDDTSLISDPASFWNAGPALASFNADPSPASVSGGTLKRLGQFPLGGEARSLELVLRRTYSAAASLALKLARR